MLSREMPLSRPPTERSKNRVFFTETSKVERLQTLAPSENRTKTKSIRRKSKRNKWIKKQKERKRLDSRKTNKKSACENSCHPENPVNTVPSENPKKKKEEKRTRYVEQFGMSIETSLLVPSGYVDVTQSVWNTSDGSVVKDLPKPKSPPPLRMVSESPLDHLNTKSPKRQQRLCEESLESVKSVTKKNESNCEKRQENSNNNCSIFDSIPEAPQYICIESCNEVFDDLITLWRHFDTHFPPSNPDKVFVCRFCQSGYIEYKQLVKHQNEKHGRVEDASNAFLLDQPQDPYRRRLLRECLYCEHAFVSEKAFRSHYEKDHAPKNDTLIIGNLSEESFEPKLHSTPKKKSKSIDGQQQKSSDFTPIFPDLSQ